MPKSGATPRVHPRTKTQAFGRNPAQTLQNRIFAGEENGLSVKGLGVFHGRPFRFVFG
jgi:hypothetical protein